MNFQTFDTKKSSREIVHVLIYGLLLCFPSPRTCASSLFPLRFQSKHFASIEYKVKNT